MNNRLFISLLALATAVFGLIGCTPQAAIVNPAEDGAPRTFFASPTPPFARPTQPSTAVPAPQIPTPEPTVAMHILQNIKPEHPPAGADVEVIATDLVNPVAFAFAPDGRLFFTEKTTGNVRIIVDGELLPEPLITLPVGTNGEQGLLGIAFDPNFEQNHYIWVTYTVPAHANNGEKINRMVRIKEQDNKAVKVETALETPNNAGDGIHNMNNLAFGQDGMLYVTVGEDNDANHTQNMREPRGKILRFMPTIPLTAPGDNPFYDGEGPNYDGIYAFGLRNSFDFVIDPLQEDVVIFATENGPSCDDEVNMILAGYNYGWSILHDCDNEKGLHPELNTIPPLWFTNETVSPTGITVYTGDDFPHWYGDILFCSYNDGMFHRLELNKARDGIISHYSINGLSCQTDVLNGPDGSLYFLEGGGYAPGTLKRLYLPE